MCIFSWKIGDYESGIETLVGAISLIKQSPTAGEERCQVKMNIMHEFITGELTGQSPRQALYNLVCRALGLLHCQQSLIFL